MLFRTQENREPSPVLPGNTTENLGIRLNLSEFKIGFEGSTAIKWDDTTVTSYTNADINAWAIVAAYIYITTGQSVPSPLHAQ